MSATTRSAKRRKLDNDESETTPPASPSVFRSLRHAVGGISRRFFEPVAPPATGTEEEEVDSKINASIEGGSIEVHSTRDGDQPRAKTPTLGRSKRTNEATYAVAHIPVSQQQTPTGDEVAVRSSGRQRKRPRRLSNELEEAAESKKSTTKTVETQAKTQTPRHDDEPIGVTDHTIESIGKEFGFKDIDGSTKKRKGKVGVDAFRGRQQEEEEEHIIVQAKSQPKARRKDVEKPQTTLPAPKAPRQKAKELPKTAPEAVVTSAAAEEEPEWDENIIEAPSLFESTSNESWPEALIAADEVDEATRTAYESIQHIILSRMNAKRRTPLIGLEDEYRKVEQVAEQTVTAGEGNSMLIIGPRGNGKTTMIETIVSDLQEKHANDFHVVRLNGFLQTDDRLALREIWRQLGREMDTEDDTSKVGSYADTMASLLALLSHPEEMSGSVESDMTSKSIVFIIDEFDLFATHARQTLLYNLFDIAQARKAPIAVFGLSTKVDVAEHLEKRVKSRFSHRYVYLAPAKNLQVFTEMCKSTLKIHDNDFVFSRKSSKDLLSAQETWNKHVETLLTSNESTRLIRREFALSKSLPTLFSSFLVSFSTTPFLPSTFPTPTTLPGNHLAAPDSHLSALPYLPPLTLSILIAAARLEILLGTPHCNFNMAYHEYISLCSRSRLQSSALTGGIGNAGGTRIWGREVARRSWEELEIGGWIVTVSGGEGGKMGGEGREERMYKVDVTLEEIDGVCFDEEKETGLGKTERGWCREL